MEWHATDSVQRSFAPHRCLPGALRCGRRARHERCGARFPRSPAVQRQGQCVGGRTKICSRTLVIPDRHPSLQRWRHPGRSRRTGGLLRRRRPAPTLCRGAAQRKIIKFEKSWHWRHTPSLTSLVDTVLTAPEGTRIRRSCTPACPTTQPACDSAVGSNPTPTPYLGLLPRAGELDEIKQRVAVRIDGRSRAL